MSVRRVWFRGVRLCLGSCALATLVGCETAGPALGEPPVLSYGRGNLPTVLIEYHPYGVSAARGLGRPVPDYSGWTEERMERDIGRIAATGVDGVILAVDVGSLDDGFRLNRYRRFLQIAGGVPGVRRGLSVCPMLVSYDAARSSVDPAGFAGWVTALGSSSGLMQVDGRPAVLVSPDLTLLGARHPAVCFMSLAPGRSVWGWPRATAPDRLSGLSSGGQIRVVAGALGNAGAGQWELPRGAGRRLRQEIWRAFRLQAAVICISSWNNFAEGSYIEPNDTDGERVVQVLTEEMGRLRRHAHPSAPAP